MPSAPRPSTLASLCLLPISALAALPFSGDVYRQDFDRLGTTTVVWADNSTLPGWYAAQDVPLAGPITLHLPSPPGTEANFRARGLWYNFGLGSDRALGLSPSGRPTGTGYYGLALVNQTNRAIDSLSLRFVWEFWFISEIKDGQDQILNVEYSTNATSLTEGRFKPIREAAITFTVSNSAGDTAWFPAAAEHPRDLTIKGLRWEPGATLWLRWVDKNEDGIDHGVGIDDVVISAASPTAPSAPPGR